MPDARNPHEAPDLGAPSLRDLLARAEACMRRPPGGDGPVHARTSSTVSESTISGIMEALEAAVAREPHEAARLAARLDQVRARHALQMRTLPDHALDGLYEDIRSTLRGETAWLRAGMSEAFLDAPASLVLWRRVAVAACLLLAVGAGYTLRTTQEGGAVGQELQPVEFFQGSSLSSGSGSWRPARANEAAWGHRRPVPGRGGAAIPASGGGLRQSHPSGLYVFRTGGDAEDAPRMLDRIQIFPVPGRDLDLDVGEEN